MRDISETIVTPMTEEECANWFRERGTRVIQHQGRYWKETVPGFYQSVHWMAQLSAQEATSPTLLSWGFQTTLCEADAKAANGSMPLHLLPNIEDYDLHSLSSNRRNHVRKFRKKVKVMELISPSVLQKHGYQVVVSALTRSGYGKPPSSEEYLAGIEKYVAPGRRIILAGFIGDKLGGYLSAYVVNDTGYIENLLIDTEALSFSLSDGLRFEFVQLCRRNGKIRQIVSGLHAREDAKLCSFKEGGGFLVKHIPAKVQMNPVVGQFIRWRYPHKYYRLTGHE
jgi:hypothetical protein